MNRAVVGLGSNLQPAHHIAAAVEALARRHRVVARSRLLETAPIGPTPQPNYLNGAILLETDLTRDELAASLHELEDLLGRTRAADKFAPRTLDLDLLAWNGEVVHRDFHERDFVRELVYEICPEFRAPETPA
jgi:2-amino-4-hydroxy-6-hydroxymethyldihydropteridine diphosphokinase